MVLHLDVGRDKTISSLEQAMLEEQQVVLAVQKQIGNDDPGKDDIYRIGTVAKVKQMIKLPNGIVRVLVEGMYRAEIMQYTEEDKVFTVEVKQMEDIHGDTYEEEAMMRLMLDQFTQYIDISKRITEETLTTIVDIDEPGRLADLVASNLPLKLKDKQEILEQINVADRMEFLLGLLSDEKNVMELERKIGERVKSSMD